MQSGLSDASNPLSEQQPLENRDSSNQHGLRPDDVPALHLSSGEHAMAEESSRTSQARLDTSQSTSDDATDALETTRLSRTPSPPHHKITEYENALTPSPRKRTSPLAFEVIQTKNPPRGDISYIASLPNEILTHAISHLSPNDLSAVSLVSRRFHDLVTTPHAWRAAFGRYFPGPESIVAARDENHDEQAVVRTERRSFARLTALASWRSEYILRTRLLRSLVRGKPLQISATPANIRAGQASNLPASPYIMYDSRLYTTINHIHAVFGTGLNKRMPRFIHGADDIGAASSSDPVNAKVDPWGLSDPQTFFQYAEAHPGDSQWGLGAGDMAGCPNTMDVSQPYGMVYGEGHPGSLSYYRAADEMRGRYLSIPSDESFPELGIPQVLAMQECTTSVWVAKSNTIPQLSDGLIGILCGLSCGIISAYSLGTDGLRGTKLGRAEVTARWVLSPGVPIISIVVDEHYSMKRQAQNRIWAVALNALGELFYLTQFPKVSSRPRSTHLLEELAWETGRSTCWNLIEPSRRQAKPDPYGDVETDGSYSPRSSWAGMCLSSQQIQAETREIEQFMLKRPKDFRRSCLGWDMRRRLEVDFAGDDGANVGESLIVFGCGVDEGQVASVHRYTRCKVLDEQEHLELSHSQGHDVQTPPSSLFGQPIASPDRSDISRRMRRTSNISYDSSPDRGHYIEEWRLSNFELGGLRSVQITTTSIDISTYATLTVSEDPTLGFSIASNASSPFASPQSYSSQTANPADIPGQRARFIAAGTGMGIVLVWDCRAPLAKSTDYPNSIEPLRVIYTDSPEISCLALTALFLVHGGNDGLVQAWDPLASTTQPIRTLNSRFSSRARRRLVQAQASAQGVGINLYAAGAICLDPDPTVLRGMVSLGTHLRYWSYSSSAADQFKSSKRRLRRGERGSNNTGERYVPGRGGNLKGYIANEKNELEREQRRQRAESDRLAGRFGVDLLDNEDEALAYATLLSQETLANEEARRQSESSTSLSERSIQSAWSDDTVTVPVSSSPPAKTEEELDADIAEAIRLSLQAESEGTATATMASSSQSDYTDGAFDIPIKYAKSKRSPKSRANKDPSAQSPLQGKGGRSAENSELDDLEFAMQLSLAEEQSRLDANPDDESFPALSPASGSKGKRRA